MKRASDGTPFWMRGVQLIKSRVGTGERRRQEWLAQQVADAYITQAIHKARLANDE